MNGQLESRKAVFDANGPMNAGYQRRGRSDLVVSCLGYNVMHQGATAGFGPFPARDDPRMAATKRSVRA